MNEKKEINLFQRILNVMNDLDYIQKGPKTVNGQYRYASHDQVTAALHPFLVKHGIVIVPTVEESTQEGNRTIVKLLTSFVNADNPQDSFSVRFIGYGIDAGDKGPGKAISYAYKYTLLKTFCLETGDDPDKEANAVYEPSKCVEFDSMIPADYNQTEITKINNFLEERSKTLGRHIEDIKREAVKRMPEFLAAVKKWNSKE